MWAAFSAIIMVGACVLPLVSVGMTEASATRRPATLLRSMWSSGAPSRFRVELTRASERDGAVVRSLSRLVVEDFGVKILPAADHWWSYRDTDSLGKALAEAGHLIVGYGLPWLAGELSPPGD